MVCYFRVYALSLFCRKFMFFIFSYSLGFKWWEKLTSVKRLFGPLFTFLNLNYKVEIRSASWLIGQPRIFRLFMKGKFDAYGQWPLEKWVQSWTVVVQPTALDYRVPQLLAKRWHSSHYFCQLLSPLESEWMRKNKTKIQALLVCVLTEKARLE